MKIAITGGNGRLGSALIPLALERGHQVVSLDRQLPAQLSYEVSHIAADVCDFGEFVAAIAGCDALVHLAAYPSPRHHPNPVVYANNTVSSYNALLAAATLGINRVCQASSINAIGGVYSRAARYDYFPVDEQHPTYAEDPYSLSKWVMEAQGDAFARRYENMRIASLRFHWLQPQPVTPKPEYDHNTNWVKHLWARTDMTSAAEACLLSLSADFSGHEVFYIVAPTQHTVAPTLELAKQYYPDVPIRSPLPGHTSLINSQKAERVLGWKST
ncbi:MAG: NAD(P)-dependent oxidoreductase [Anaerolineae bacterium]|nr:NAD(P)-dependent oxidoreductase [Anaerolineae bacterium]